MWYVHTYHRLRTIECCFFLIITCCFFFLFVLSSQSSDRETIRSTYPSYESNVTVEDSTTGRFEPPYVTGGTHARDMSRMVNARRTPSGNFFQVANPSLAPKQPKVKVFLLLFFFFYFLIFSSFFFFFI